MQRRVKTSKDEYIYSKMIANIQRYAQIFRDERKYPTMELSKNSPVIHKSDMAEGFQLVQSSTDFFLRYETDMQ